MIRVAKNYQGKLHVKCISSKIGPWKFTLCIFYRPQGTWIYLTRGPFVALAWHVPSQRCFHRLGCKGVGCCLYQACMYDLNWIGSVLEVIGVFYGILLQLMLNWRWYILENYHVNFFQITKYQIHYNTA